MALKILIFGLLAFSLGNAQTVNCLVAVVDGEAITLTDVHIVYEFGLYDRREEKRGEDPRFAALDALIARKVVLAMARDTRGISPTDLTHHVATLRDDYGEDVFYQKLRKFLLREDDLVPYLKDRILFDRVVAARFSQTIPVSRGDVEKYYREIYRPEQESLGRTAGGLAEVTPQLESRIRAEIRTKQVKDWILNLRSRAEIQIKQDCLK